MRSARGSVRGVPDDTRVGIVGYGLAGAVFHAPLIAATPGLRVEAIVTSNPERSRRAARDFPDARVVPSAQEMLGEVEVVVVAAANRAHVPISREAIAAGAAVVVDKPLAPTAAAGRELVEEARAAGVLLTVFQNRRWDGDFLTLRQLLAGGDAWRDHAPRVALRALAPAGQPGAWRERADPEEGGGLLLDLGSHLVDQAMLLFGRPPLVYAEVERRRPGAAIDDDVFLALDHEGGVRSHLWASAVAPALGPRFRALGSKAGYVKPGLDPQEAALSDGARPGDPGWGAEDEERWGRLIVGSDERAVPTRPGAYEEFYAGVAAALRDVAPAPVDAMDSVAGLEVLEAAARSAAERSVVEV